MLKKSQKYGKKLSKQKRNEKYNYLQHKASGKSSKLKATVHIQPQAQ